MELYSIQKENVCIKPVFMDVSLSGKNRTDFFLLKDFILDWSWDIAIIRSYYCYPLS